MDPVQTLDSRIAAKHLLDHTFYQRWTCGTLTREELRDYAAQYFHYAMAFPTFISAMHAQTDDIATRQLLLENLIEEESSDQILSEVAKDAINPGVATQCSVGGSCPSARRSPTWPSD